ncbi:DUF4588 domain-containing protein [Patescibacteria group bacterium]|nr:DUF4588 domain-containing protein [Patescibacteria group bacterium]MCL5092021.1 DUF4588 domain-containing protein [Patescibacteria group bacterium]
MATDSAITRSQLLPIFTLLEKRQFKLAEKNLIKILRNLIESNQDAKKRSNWLGLTQILYSDFNRSYLSWAKNRGRNIRREISTLHSDSHDNFLLAHCTDSASVDDLFYAMMQSASQRRLTRQNREISKQLELYSHLIQA